MQSTMQFVKLVCNYCGTTAEGYKGDLEMLGWTTAEVVVKGSYVRKTACPAHREFLKKR